MVRLTITSTVCLAVLCVGPGISWGNVIVNGDFEDTTGWGDLGTGDVPAGWGGTNCAVMQTGENAIGGTGTSALMVAGTGKITQSFDQTSPQWRKELDFASEDPGDASARSLTGSIFNSGNALITYRVNGDGDFQVFERGGAGWYTPSGLAKAVIFDDDVESMPLVHHLTMVGHFHLEIPNYDIILTNSNNQVFEALGLTSWNKPGDGLGPTTGQGIDMIDPSTTISTADYLIDNIEIVSEGAIPPNLFINGDFEDTAGWGGLGTPQPPPGWASTSNPAVMQSGINAIGGTGTSALMVAGGGSIAQDFDETDAQWRRDLDFASEDPGDASARSLTGSVFNSGNALITYRVNGDGDFQVYERGGAGWYTPDGLAGAVIFDDDVESMPLVHHLTMIGHFHLETPTYDIIVTNSNNEVFEALGLTSWNRPGDGLGPETGWGIDRMDFGTSASTADYLIDNITLSGGGAPGVEGDLNGDGMVGSADLDIVRGNWGQTVEPGCLSCGDPSGDGTVGSADLDIVRANWGATAAAAVPEPTCWVLLAGAFGAWMLRRNGK